MFGTTSALPQTYVFVRDGVEYRVIVVGGNTLPGTMTSIGPWLNDIGPHPTEDRRPGPTAWELKRELSIRGVQAWTDAYNARELSRAQHRADVCARPRPRWSSKRRSAKAVRNWRRQ